MLPEPKIDKSHFLTVLYRINPSDGALKTAAQYIQCFNDPETVIGGLEFVHGKSGIDHRLTLYFLIWEIMKYHSSSDKSKPTTDKTQDKTIETSKNVSGESKSTVLFKQMLNEFVKKNFPGDCENAKGYLEKGFKNLAEGFKKRGIL